jgi:hypothetical protein
MQGIVTDVPVGLPQICWNAVRTCYKQSSS